MRLRKRVYVQVYVLGRVYKRKREEGEGGGGRSAKAHRFAQRGPARPNAGKSGDAGGSGVERSRPSALRRRRTIDGAAGTAGAAGGLALSHRLCEPALPGRDSVRDCSFPARPV